MKTLQLFLLLFCSSFLLLSSQCKKNDSSPPLTELQKLPAITQGGHNTFGCLINGKAFVPGGGSILNNPLSVQYDPTFQGGKLSVGVKNYINGSNFTFVEIGGDSIHLAGTYTLSLHSRYTVGYNNTQLNCNFFTYYDTPISGTLIINRFDTITRIISGTFSFKVSTSQCGSIEGTDGRFDIRY